MNHYDDDSLAWQDGSAKVVPPSPKKTYGILPPRPTEPISPPKKAPAAFNRAVSPRGTGQNAFSAPPPPQPTTDFNLASDNGKAKVSDSSINSPRNDEAPGRSLLARPGSDGRSRWFTKGRRWSWVQAIVADRQRKAKGSRIIASEGTRHNIPKTNIPLP